MQRVTSDRSLRTHSYSNIYKISPPKTEKFQIVNSDIFHIFAQKHRLWDLAEAVLTSTPQSMFLSKNKKNNVYPCKPQFYCIKVGFKGRQNYIHVGMFSWCKHKQLSHFGRVKRKQMLSNMRKTRWFRSSCECSMYHLGLCSPFIHSVVCNDHVFWPRLMNIRPNRPYEDPYISFEKKAWDGSVFRKGQIQVDYEVCREVLQAACDK